VIAALRDEFKEVQKMSREYDCIRELYELLDAIAENVRHGDLSLVEKPKGIGMCNEPPICKMLDDVLDKYGGVIRMAYRAKELEEWNRRAEE